MKKFTVHGGIPYRQQDYSLLESFFGNYQWVRKLSKGYWVRRLEAGYDWVKYDKNNLKDMGFNFENRPTEYLVEDYT